MKINRYNSRSMFPAGLMLLTTALLLGGTGTAHAECYIGCLTPGGTIHHMTLGPVPLKRCNPEQQVIQLCGSNHRDQQNEQAKVDFTQFCKAFSDAAISPLPEGCPDDGGLHSPTDFSVAGPGGGPAPVRFVGEHDFNLHSGSNGNPYDLCGLIQAVSEQPPHGHLLLPKSYFHKKISFIEVSPVNIGGTSAFDAAQARCKQACEADRFCAVADLFNTGSTTSGSEDIFEFSCSIYHQSPDITSGYTEECDGNLNLDFDFSSEATQELCAQKARGITTPGNWWYVRQPDGCVPN